MHTDTGPGGIYAVFTETGHAPAMYREEVRCRAPSPDEVNRLGVPASASVIEIIRQAFQTDGRCIEVNRMVPVSPTSETVS
jgi:GntR family transcriptional regulator